MRHYFGNTTFVALWMKPSIQTPHAPLGRRLEAKSFKRYPDATKVCVGYDGRLSSPSLETAIIEGICATGLHVIRIGLGPTPMLYHATVMTGADAGLMVTGSHNPPNHNGFKMLVRGKPFFGEDIQNLRKRIERHDHTIAPQAGNVTEQNTQPNYVTHLLQAYHGKKPLKVIWDPANGAAGDVVSELTKQLPGEHHVLNGQIDGTFPNHHADPTVPENLQQLIRTVQSEKAELGVAFDGDGDRLGVVDSEGTIIWGDQLLALYAEELLESSPGATVIADVKASQMLFDRIAGLGGTPLMWKTGHSLIKAKMAETNAPLAGEMSGHLFFADNHRFDDGIYAAVRLISLLANRTGSLAAWLKAQPKAMNTPEIRIPCDESQKWQVMDAIREQLRAQNADMNEVDGVRVQTDEGWWLLRPSNTQAVLVARCEAQNTADLEKLKETLFGLLKKQGLNAQ
jgi:phosphomannomutase